ncbi:hypothetical protein BDZ89DRAFT_1230276 [Hymenopellis radicata]|nr:hypothetical protein BDZ89DRAFT_1230276 [Hymenopellis radicata]
MSVLGKVVVDSTDPRINYTGSDWIMVGPFADGYGVPVYNGSQSMAKGAGDRFSFLFEGSTVEVFGAWDYTASPLPRCTVDDIPIGSSSPLGDKLERRARQLESQSNDDFAQNVRLFTNQMPLCGATGLDATGAHTLVVQHVDDARLVFDYLLYTPVAESAVPDGAVRLLDVPSQIIETSNNAETSTITSVEEVTHTYEKTYVTASTTVIVIDGDGDSKVVVTPVTSVRILTSATATTTVTVTANRDLTTTLTNYVTVVETATVVDTQTVTHTDISISAVRPTATPAFISLSGSWQQALGNTAVDFGDSFYTAIMPRNNSSTLAATFNGSEISMIGILDNIEGAEATGNYSIDGGTPTTFALSSTTASRGTLFQQTLFRSGRLNNTRHEILVQWNGDEGQQRFGFTNFYVQNGDLPSPVDSAPLNTVSASLPANARVMNSGKVPIRTIVGSVLGAVISVAAALGIWLWRRKMHAVSSDRAPDIDPDSPISTMGSLTTTLVRSQALRKVFGSSQGSVADLKAEQSRVIRGRHERQLRLDPEIRMHEDSGLRWDTNTQNHSVVDIPPAYAV